MTELLAWSVIACWGLAAVCVLCLLALSREEASSPVESRFGISPEPVRLGRTGYLLEFRFHVVDPARASEWLAGTDGHACLMDLEGGVVLPSLGHPRFCAGGAQGGALAWGDTRSILFADPDHALILPGRATLVFGETRIENLEIIRAE